MATPDVRLRLSAEGVQQIVNELRRIQAESAKVSQNTGANFLKINSVLSATQQLASQLGAAIGAAAFVKFIRDATQAADELGRVAQGVGTSVENLSALRLAAAESDVPMEALTRTLALTARRTQEFKAGSDVMVQAFAKLGIAQEQFNGKDTAERLDIISKAFFAFPDGPEKSALALQLFGKNAAIVVPLLNQLGREGLPEVTRRAQELGAVISEDVVAAADALGDEFSDLKLQTQALGAQFAAGLAPDLLQALQSISGELAGQADAWRELGKIVGVVLRFILGVLSPVVQLVDQIGVGLGNALIRIDGIVRATAAAVRGDRARVEQLRQLVEETTSKNEKDLIARHDRRLDQLFAKAETPKPQPTTSTDAEAAAKFLEEVDAAQERADDKARQRRERENEQRLQLTRQRIEAERSLLSLQARQAEEDERRNLEQSLVSVADHYAHRRQIVIDAANAQKEAIDREIKEEQKSTNAAQARANIERLEAEKRRIDQETKGTTAALTFEELQATRKLGEERVRVEREVLEARGQTHEAAINSINQQAEAYRQLLVAQSVSLEERTRLVQEFRDTLTNRADFDEINRQITVEVNELQRRRQEVQSDIDAHLVSQAEGEQRILKLEQDRVSTLNELVTKLSALAKDSHNPELEAQAKELETRFKNLGISVEKSHNELSSLNESIASASVSGLANLLTGPTESVKNFGQASLQAAAQFSKAIADIIARAFALQAVKGLFRILGVELPVGFGGSGGGVVQRATGGVVGAARGFGLARVSRSTSEWVRRASSIAGQSHSAVSRSWGEMLRVSRARRGGLIRGPGTGTSDSIHDLLPFGTFIVRAAVVQRPGVRAHLDAFLQGAPAPVSSGLRHAFPPGLMPARVSAGEYELPPEVVAQPGMLEHLRELNQTGSIATISDVRGMAEGGLASNRAVGGEGGRGGDGVDGRLLVELGPDLVARHLRTRAGQEQVVQIVERNRRTLGIRHG